MNNLVDLWKRPKAEEIYMIAGWQQWADAGSVSSGLPQYLVQETNAQKIGEFTSEDFYIFQIPGTHHFLRPEISLEEGYRQSIEARKNEFFYTEIQGKGLVIFLGDEPQIFAHRYAEAFFDMVQTLGVKRVGVVGGVYGSMPYDKDREISCSFSLLRLKQEMQTYAVRFSNYEGGATISSYLLDMAEQRNQEYFVFHVLVPAYDFSQMSDLTQGIRIENDFKAWYDIMRRFNHMFEMNFNLTDLEAQSEELLQSMHIKLAELERKMPELNVRDYVAQVSKAFQEKSFMPLDDVWARELGDLNLFDEDDNDENGRDEDDMLGVR